MAKVLKNVSLIEYDGFADVSGVVVYNGPQPYFDKTLGKWLNNYTAAKKDSSGRDHTSADTIRHFMFRDLVPVQPTEKVAKELVVRMAASLIGLLRGFLDPGSTKRATAISLNHAWTDVSEMTRDKDGQWQILIPMAHRSSRPSEDDLKDKDGNDKSNANFWYKDDAPPRRQMLSGVIKIDQVQILDMDERGSTPIVLKSERGLFLTELAKTAKSIGAKWTAPTEAENVVSATDIYQSVKQGVILPDDFIGKLAKEALRRHGTS